MPKKDKDALTEMQQRFADAYLIEPNGTKAAIAAGYSEKTAASTAWRLLRNTKVMAAISKARNERCERTNVDQDRVIFLINDTAERCSGEGEHYQPQHVLKAAELLGRHLGMFTDKLEVDSGLEGLGDRLQRALKRIEQTQDDKEQTIQ
jgi:phage terminase small subunit